MTNKKTRWYNQTSLKHKLKYLVLTGFILYGFITFIDMAYAQEAAEGLNNSFGGVSDSLRGLLDTLWGIDKFFGNMGCYLQGTFMGWDNVDCVIND